MNGAAAPVTAGKLGRRIVLHFDINKTIISNSTSGNVNNSTLAVCHILSKLVWGKMVTKKVGDKEEQ